MGHAAAVKRKTKKDARAPAAKRAPRVVRGSATRAPKTSSEIKHLAEHERRKHDIQTAMERLLPPFDSLSGGSQAWHAIRNFAATALILRRLLPETSRSADRAQLRKLAASIECTLRDLAALGPRPAFSIGGLYRAEAAPLVADTSRAATDLAALAQAVQDALKESLAAGSGAKVDGIAWEFAKDVWCTLCDAQIVSDTAPTSTFAQCLDVTLPLIEARISTATVLAKFGNAVTVSADRPAPALPTLLELLHESPANRPAKKTRVTGKRRP
jgi:hypothetical protein